MPLINLFIKNLFISLVIFSCLSCAVPGPKFVDLAYVKNHSPTQTGKFGITQFKDNRQNTEQGYVGRRILTDKSQETYLVRGMNLSASLTELTRVYLEKTGFVVTPFPDWTPTLDKMAQVPGGLALILSADINTFECRAQKNGTYTKMILDMDLTFHLGNIQDKKLSTIPVSLVVERTELTFSSKKLEQFINQAFEEILEKAIPFK